MRGEVAEDRRLCLLQRQACHTVVAQRSFGPHLRDPFCADASHDHRPDGARSDITASVSPLVECESEFGHELGDEGRSLPRLEVGIPGPQHRTFLHGSGEPARLGKAVASSRAVHAMQLPPQRVEHLGRVRTVGEPLPERAQRVERVAGRRPEALTQPLERLGLLLRERAAHGGLTDAGTLVASGRVRDATTLNS